MHVIIPTSEDAQTGHRQAQLASEVLPREAVQDEVDAEVGVEEGERQLLQRCPAAAVLAGVLSQYKMNVTTKTERRETALIQY